MIFCHFAVIFLAAPGVVDRPIYICIENTLSENQRQICFFCCKRLLAFVLYMHTTHTEHTVSDKILDLLEFCAAAAISVGFIFLSAYVLVGGI